MTDILPTRVLHLFHTFQVDELRGTPMNVGSLEEIIDEK